MRPDLGTYFREVQEMMTLDEAIEHCKEKSCSNTDCAREHRQLAEWLEELKEYKRRYGELNAYDYDLRN